MSTTESRPRIAPLQPPYAPDIAAQLIKWMPPETAVEPLALFRTLAVHDELFGRMRPLGAGILGHGRVPPRAREIVILRTCARAGAEYEWGVHAVLQAPEVGLTPAQIDATAVGAPPAPAWSGGGRAQGRRGGPNHPTPTGCQVQWGEQDAR
ncbi:carboxymuconolactone decarboxylase family protein [Nocardia brasiliensis]|uniref:carboxymuconolactone decarboxylase family protein n=1 Tax=Nocardia brasiliensis TaxID=37326 RepID=UPI0024552AA8|nr:carboxymuconolactone decarboxylase family protein [Nocardia brasiliensis]